MKRKSKIDRSRILLVILLSLIFISLIFSVLVINSDKMLVGKAFEQSKSDSVDLDQAKSSSEDLDQDKIPLVKEANYELNCFNNNDDDGDDKIDCVDEDCFEPESGCAFISCDNDVCAEGWVCYKDSCYLDSGSNNANFADNICQSFDYEKHTWAGDLVCIISEICDSGLDEDADGKIDCEDSNCKYSEACMGSDTGCKYSEASNSCSVDYGSLTTSQKSRITSNCVLDENLNKCVDHCTTTAEHVPNKNNIDCSVAHPNYFKELCNNDVDDDEDGKIDCADSDCCSTNACSSLDSCKDPDNDGALTMDDNCPLISNADQRLDSDDQLFYDAFSSEAYIMLKSSFSGVKVWSYPVDDGHKEFPSSWNLVDGMLKQNSNIHNLPNDDSDYLGTYYYAGNLLTKMNDEFDYNLRDYHFHVKMRSKSDNDIMGVMFRFDYSGTTPEYYRLRWNKEKRSAWTWSSSSQKAGLILEKKVGDTFTELAYDDGAYNIGQWYNIRVELKGPRIKVFVDSEKKFDVLDYDLDEGTVALYTWGNINTYFDDVRITQNYDPNCDEVCDDGLDNDGDGLIDCFDTDCIGKEGRRESIYGYETFGICEQDVETICDDGFNNDGDTKTQNDPNVNNYGQVTSLTDCSDPDCANDPICLPEMVCNDNEDNDNDGDTDCEDSDCVGENNIIGWKCCQSNNNCNDWNSCTLDTCNNNFCANNFNPTEGCCKSDAACDDASYCDVEKYQCVGQNEDGQSCTEDKDCIGFCIDGICGSDEICDDGLDNDNDDSTDCADSDCEGFESDLGFSCEQGNYKETICDDGIDNEGEYFYYVGECVGGGDAGATYESEMGCESQTVAKLTDCADPDCVSLPACVSVEICDDGSDNDNDGSTDCADKDCYNVDKGCAFLPCENGQCADGWDCYKGGCYLDSGSDNANVADQICQSFDYEKHTWAGDLVCIISEICDSGLDEDADGKIDCADSQCVNDPACYIEEIDTDGDGLSSDIDDCPNNLNLILEPNAAGVYPVFYPTDIDYEIPGIQDYVDLAAESSGDLYHSDNFNYRGCPKGDIDKAGGITGWDFSLWLTEFNEYIGQQDIMPDSILKLSSIGDLNQDGRLTGEDFSSWLIEFNTHLEKPPE